MATNTPRSSHRRWARWLLLLLVIIPILPEIFIWTVGGVAVMAGCTPGQHPPACKVQSVVISEMIEKGLSAAGILSSPWSIYFYLAIGAWLVVCLIVLVRGWERLMSRLTIGAAITALFALLPFVGPWFAIDTVADNACQPQKSKIGCLLFGGVVRNTYAAFRKRDFEIPDVDALFIAGVVGIFAVFAMVVMFSGVISARRAVESGRSSSD